MGQKQKANKRKRITKKVENNNIIREDNVQSEDKTVYDFLNNIIKYIEGNAKAITWLSTIVVAITAVVLKYVWYVLEAGKLAYWKIDYSAMATMSDNVLYNIVLMFAESIVFLVIVLLPMAIIRNGKKKVRKIVCMFLVFSIFLSFIVDLRTLLEKTGKAGLVVFIIFSFMCFGVVLGLSFLVSYCLLPPEKNLSEGRHSSSSWKLCWFLVWIAVEIVSLYSIRGYFESIREEFRIIDSAYAIVYENNEYYYLVEYDTNTNMINKDVQKIIKKENIEYRWEKVNLNKK